MAKEYKKAVVAGGCFWCIEHDLKHLSGVVDTQVGYAGGSLENPTYEQVSGGGSGHVEALEITYDPDTLSYGDLLKAFWQNVDPYDGGGQFCDRGPQYRTVVFTKTADEQSVAEDVKRKLENQLGGRPFATDLLSYVNFYPAEDYHQDYSDKNAIRYSFYRWNCGRDKRVKDVWGETKA